MRPINEREAQTMSFNYSMPLPKPALRIMGWLPTFMPKSWAQMQFRPLPASLTYAVNGSRRTSRLLRRGDAAPTEQEDFALVETYASKLNPLSGLSANYNLKIDRDLRKKFALDKRSFGREVGRKTNGRPQSFPALGVVAGSKLHLQGQLRGAETTQRSGAGWPRSIRSAACRSRPLTSTTRTISPHASISKFRPCSRTWASLRGKAARRSRATTASKTKPQTRTRQPQKTTKPSRQKGPISSAASPGGPAASSSRSMPVGRRNTNSRHFNLLHRPSLSYQLGLDDTLRVRQVTQGLTHQDNWSHTGSFEAGSGMRLPFGISVKVNSKEQTTQRSGASQQRLRPAPRAGRTPRLSLSWGRADRLPLIKRVINSAQVNASFETSEGSEGRGQPRAPVHLLSEETKTEFRASWNGRWRWGPTTTIERVISIAESRDFEPTAEGGDGTQPLRGTRDQERVATTFKITHNLKPAAGCPLIGRLKSDVTLNLEQRFERETRSIATGDETRIPNDKTNSWRTQLSMTYNFSANFRGEGRIRIENKKDHIKVKTRKIREVRLSGTFFLR